jgi:hypothetical protein
VKSRTGRRTQTLPGINPIRDIWPGPLIGAFAAWHAHPMGIETILFVFVMIIAIVIYVVVKKAKVKKH